MFPHLIGRRGPGAYVPTSGPAGGGGSGGGISDGGSAEPPVVTTNASGDVTVKGKIKPGSFGKIIVPLASVQAGRQYTFRYTPQFSQLAQQGKLAMVGFGFKNNNDFHIVGLRGDGSTGLHKYKVYGTPPNGWNKDTGHTVSDGGASANGSQAGPNYIRIVISADGATYKFQTSANGSAWTDEFTGAVPSPFANISGVLNFGLALWFNNADAGPFSITVDQIADAASPVILEYLSTQVDTSASVTTFTLSSVSIGAADVNRRVFVAFSVGGATTNISSVTIGGITATRAIDGISTSSGRQAIYYADVPTGTTATIVITTSASCTTCICSVYKTTIANMVALDVLTNFDTGTVSLALSDLSIVTGGFALVQGRADAGTIGTTYNGADTPTQDDLTTSGLVKNVLSKSFLTTENADTNDVTVTSTSSTALWGVAASFFVNTKDKLDPQTRGTDIRLSNTNLTAGKAFSSWQSAHSIKSHTSGKYYFEMTANAMSSQLGAGFCNSSSNMNDFIGDDANGILIINNGGVVVSGSYATFVSAFAVGDVVGVAIDLGADLFWCRTNGGNWNNDGSANPATGVGGISLPSGIASGAVFAGISVNTSGDSGTVNFGDDTAFVRSPPSGYSAWG